jgi:membrane carboxypeptidase/penicillin-binding protein PbpC
MPQPLPPVSERRSPIAAAPSVEEFRIVSPNEGDVYRMPPGVDARYATVALRAAGGPSNAAVRWVVDGSPFGESRWPLQPGRHRFRAVSSAGDSAEVTVSVE